MTPESSGTIRESPGLRLVNKKWGLTDGSNNEHDFEANSRYGGPKRRETVSPIDIRVSLGDDFFNDIESCSTKSVNLDEVVLFSLLNFLFILLFFGVFFPI